MLNSRRNLILGAILLVGVTFILTAGGALYLFQQMVPDTTGTVKLIRAMDVVRNRYIEPVSADTLMNGAIRGMVGSLNDPYSIYMDTKMYREFRMETEGSFSGVGIVISVKDKQLTVVSPIEGTPGERAGIRSGDQIIKIDGKDTKELALDEAVSKIRGKEGTDVTLTLRRGEAVKDYKLTRANIEIKTVSSRMLPEKIAVIRLAMFNEKTAGEFFKQYEALEAQGMKATILDLRDNPGGLLDSSVKVSNKLVPKGPVVSVVTRDGQTEVHRSDLAAVKYPLVVLVNGGSASASEIVAGAVQDTGAGTLIGTKTFGKGSVQSIVKLSSDTAIKLTIAKYATPNNRFINGIGIEPDQKVENPEPKGDATVRPGRLPITGSAGAPVNPDQPADLQMEAAISLLKGKL
jgi:carboxyl-terminal processing protease